MDQEFDILGQISEIGIIAGGRQIREDYLFPASHFAFVDLPPLCREVTDYQNYMTLRRITALQECV